MSGQAPVSYGQIYVESAQADYDVDDCFRGQRNGLCGAASAGTLFLITGMHTGDVGFAVEAYDEEPVIDESWEEIVEASYQPGGEAALVSWGGEGRWPLALAETTYRVRYCGSGMDAAHDSDPPMDDEPPVDRYVLQFWPAPAAPDRIVKRTSELAAYWHRTAQALPPPLTPEQVAAAEAKRAADQAELWAAERLESWGGRLPSERVQQVQQASRLARLDRELLDELDASDAETLTAVARWSARQACAAAGLDQIDWIADALDRMDQGVDFSELLRPPAGTFDGSFAIMHSGDWDASRPAPIQALLTLTATYDEEPLRAAIATLWLAVGASGPEVVARLRTSFPQLRNPVR
ncbi:hypothetical protein GCM10009534_02990 [Kribbella sandramycini]